MILEVQIQNKDMIIYAAFLISKASFKWQVQTSF